MKQVLFLLSISTLFLIPCFAQESLSCPNISVVTPKQIYDPGESIPFSISPSEELKNLKLEYKWAISEGTIVQGQGTPAILLSTAGLADLSINPTVEIKGLPRNCPNTFSGKAVLVGKPGKRIISDHSYLWNYDEIKARVASFYSALNNQPTARGVVIINGTKKEIEKREAEIRKAVRFGKYNIKRIEFVRDSCQPETRTRFFIVPKGKETPSACH